MILTLPPTRGNHWTTFLSERIYSDEAMRECQNTPGSCPVSFDCVERHEETVFEYQRSTAAWSATSDTITIDLYLESEPVGRVDLGAIMDDTDMHSITRQNLGRLPKWDSIRITTTGRNEGALSIFRLKESGEVVFDLVAIKGVLRDSTETAMERI